MHTIIKNILKIFLSGTHFPNLKAGRKKKSTNVNAFFKKKTLLCYFNVPYLEKFTHKIFILLSFSNILIIIANQLICIFQIYFKIFLEGYEFPKKCLKLYRLAGIHSCAHISTYIIMNVENILNKVYLFLTKHENCIFLLF